MSISACPCLFFVSSLDKTKLTVLSFSTVQFFSKKVQSANFISIRMLSYSAEFTSVVVHHSDKYKVATTTVSLHSLIIIGINKK